jgi:hypothetical protein
MSRFRACGLRALVAVYSSMHPFLHRTVSYFYSFHSFQPTVHWRIVAIVVSWFSHRTHVCSLAIPTISGFLTKRYVVFYSYYSGSESSNVFRQRQLNQSHAVTTPSVKIKYVDIQYPKIKTGPSIVTVGMCLFFF